LKTSLRPPSSNCGSVKWILAVVVVLAGCAAWYFSTRTKRPGTLKNVVLISIDTCRADRLSCYGYSRPTTPNIDAVAREGVLFERAQTPVPLTTPAHSSMLTGLYPPSHGLHLNNGDHLADANVTLAECLREAGFRTGGFVGAFPLDARLELDQGFDTYDGTFADVGHQAGHAADRTAEEVNRSALDWLGKDVAKPFFLFLHYYDAHQPFEPPQAFATAFAGDPYAGEIAHVDQCIGQVLDRLRTLGVYDDTLVIITSDHGESLGEHGESGHALMIYQSTLHVPLIIRTPTSDVARRIADGVSLVDIVPTVLDLVGAKSPPRVQGISLRAALTGQPLPVREWPLYSESLEAASFGCSTLDGLLEGNWKYIRAPRQELFDTAVDPGELKNLFGTHTGVAENLRRRLEASIQKMVALAPGRSRGPVDQAAVKRFESLGYVGGGTLTENSTFDARLEDPKDFLQTYESLQRINLLVQTGRGNEAVPELQTLVTGRPRLITPHAMLGLIAAGERRFDEAVLRCAAIVSILLDSKESGRSPPGESDELVAGRLDTRDLATAHVNLAHMLTQAGRTSEAVDQFERALKVRPDFAEAHFQLGVLLAQTGKAPVAKLHFEEAVRLNPEHAGARLNLANTLMQSGQTDKALEQYAQAVRIDPNYADAQFYFGSALQKAGRQAEALERFERVLRLLPDYARLNPRMTPALNEARAAASAKR